MKILLSLLLLPIFLVSQAGEGKHGSSLQDFSSQSAYIQADANLTGSAIGTVQTWMYPGDTYTGSQPLTHSANGSDHGGFSIWTRLFMTSNNEWCFLWTNNSGSIQGPPIPSSGEDYDATNFPPRWHMLTVTWDTVGTDSLKFYHDVTKLNSVVMTVTHCTETDITFRVGRMVSDPNYFEGKICQVRVWKRVLESAEIAWNFRHPEAVYDTTDMILWWKIDEGSGTVINDFSSSSNDGTTTNDPLWTIDTPIIGGGN